jgi:hypothetical protein
MPGARATYEADCRGPGGRFSSVLLLPAIAGLSIACVSSASDAGGNGAGRGAVANTYYVAPTGSNFNSCAAARNALTPKKTIQAGLGCLAPGSTLIIRDGTYSGSANALRGLPNGSPGRYITIKAQNEGKVIITDGLDMAHTNAYLIFQGLRFQDSGGRGIFGNHLKFFRNEFKGGCASGNCANTGVGTNDFNDTADILFEDNWWHGAGGRYNLLVYNANRVVVRRAVIRHDGGWTDTKGDPEAGLNFYNSTECSAQNVIILDSNLAYHTWQSAFYSVHMSDSPNANTDNSWLGIIALNNASPKSDAAGLRFDGNASQSNHVVKDAVLWDAFSGMNVSYHSSVGVTASGLTIGQTRRGNIGVGIQGRSRGVKAFTNVIIANMADADLSGVSATFFDTFNNGSTSSGTGRLTSSPFGTRAGLMYLPRIEAGSALKTAGSGGGQIGAQIVNRIGAAGTLRGETGWDADTGAPLWPFPNEARIMKEMCTDARITRGFCSDTSLTHYIMNYLGNGNPY